MSITADPFLLSTWSFSQRGAAEAWPMLMDGAVALDAAERICVVAELDPTVDSVGYGGLPDRSGAVTLDGCVMLDPARCGGVCAIERHGHPVSLARLVMDHTSHVLLAGPGADRFADEHGVPAAELLAPEAAERFEAWKRDPKLVDPSRDSSLRPVDDGEGGPLFGHDTVGVLACDQHGTLAGACSTSGLAYKRPGRVGDSPIIGHGLYVDPEVGAATATGTGEIISGMCTTALIIESMRRGAAPKEAIAEMLQRTFDRFTLRAGDQVGVIAVASDGTWSSGALRSGYRTVRADAAGIQLHVPEIVIDPDRHVPE